MKTIRPSVLILKNNKILVLKSKYSSGEFYLLPGGNIEEFETTQETAIRETKEETNYDIRIEKLLYMQEWINQSRNKNVLYMIFLGTIISGDETHLNDPCLDEGHIQKIKWIEIDELMNLKFYPKDILPEIKKSINKGLEKQETLFLEPSIDD